MWYPAVPQHQEGSLTLKSRKEVTFQYLPWAPATLPALHRVRAEGYTLLAIAPVHTRATLASSHHDCHAASASPRAIRPATPLAIVTAHTPASLATPRRMIPIQVGS